MKINGQTQIIGFLGKTFKTSKMYAIYNAAFETSNLNYVYIPFVVDNLKKAVDGIRHLGIRAVGVTIPYKIEIIKYLDELDNNAKRIGAVNVIIHHNGKLTGYNTDGLGGMKALKEITTISGKKIIILGAGGAARALAFALSDEKANIVILNRTIELARDLAEAVGSHFGGITDLRNEIKDTDIIINSTSVGMASNNNESLVDKKLLQPDLIVMDVVTNPRETKLIKDAKERGCKIVYGERTLFWQAVLKFKLFTGMDAPIKVMERTLYA